MSTQRAAFPHHYEMAVSARGDGSSVLSAGPRPAILGGPPPQFEGKDEWWSPEHLLLSALSLCLQTTFQAFAAKEALAVRRYESVVKGVLDRTPAGLRFTSIVLEVDLEVGAADEQRANRLLETAKKYCIVANSLNTPVDLRVSVAVA